MDRPRKLTGYPSGPSRPTGRPSSWPRAVSSRARSVPGERGDPVPERRVDGDVVRPAVRSPGSMAPSVHAGSRSRSVWRARSTAAQPSAVRTNRQPPRRRCRRRARPPNPRGRGPLGEQPPAALTRRSPPHRRARPRTSSVAAPSRPATSPWGHSGRSFRPTGERHGPGRRPAGHRGGGRIGLVEIGRHLVIQLDPLDAQPADQLLHGVGHPRTAPASATDRRCPSSLLTGDRAGGPGDGADGAGRPRAALVAGESSYYGAEIARLSAKRGGSAGSDPEEGKSRWS